MLSPSAFQVLSKTDFYQFYTEVYKKWKRRNYHELCNCIQRFFIQGSTKIYTEPTGITETSKKVRSFQAFHIKEEQGNIGSSLMKNRKRSNNSLILEFIRIEGRQRLAQMLF